ncbi:MAG: ankyrin repeat domain-containing protein [Gemmatimonadota bacterium]
MSSPFGRSLSAHPDLAQQRKQSKELLRAFEAGNSEARARVRAALPDKKQITLADAQFVLAREYGFTNWAALKQHIDERVQSARTAVQRVHDAFAQRDASALKKILQTHPELRARIHEPVFGFDAPAIVAFAWDRAMVDALLDLGADPNQRSAWWAGPFHALHFATGDAAERLLAAGAIPDACAASHLDRAELLAQMIAEDPSRVHERGGDGQTPLHFAQSRAAIDLLLDAGADIDARDVDHRSTAAEWMLDRTRGAGRYDLARYLVERGASTDIFLAAALGLTDRARTMLANDPGLLDERTGQGSYGEQPPSSSRIHTWTIGDGRSPLEVAAQFEHDETLRAMLAFATPLQQLRLAYRRGDEAAALALLREHPSLTDSISRQEHRTISDAAWEGDAKAVTLMLSLGFDPRTPGHDSGTALHCAAWRGSVETVATLLAHPEAAELIAVKDAHYGATPLGWCCHGSVHGDTTRDHAKVARLLLEAGARTGADTEHASPEVEAVLASRPSTP